MNIPLWSEEIARNETKDKGTINEGCPSLTPYLLEGEGPYPVVIVCPGGGYQNRADHEGEPVAKWLNRIGISALVLNYRVAPYKHPIPLNDAKRAIRIVRARAKQWNLDPNRLGILGFSAGGHLASSAGTHYDHGNAESDDLIEQMSSRPDLMILCYPVITFGSSAHSASKENLLGAQPSAELINLLSNERQVNASTPPAFLWHTADDAAVPVNNVLLFAQAMERYKIPCELHVFESGKHGLGLAQDTPGAKVWSELCESWLNGKGFI